MQPTEEEKMEGQPQTVLEALYAVRSRLRWGRTGPFGERSRYSFADWSACTVGNVYTATHGHKTYFYEGSTPAMTSRNPLFAGTLRAILRAAGGDTGGALPLLVTRVSGLTWERARPGLLPRSLRKTALRLVEDAIAMVEEEQRQARLAVIAEAERVVAAEPAEVVPA